jgi:hypothetical protein
MNGAECAIVVREFLSLVLSIDANCEHLCNSFSLDDIFEDVAIMFRNKGHSFKVTLPSLP